MEENKNQQKDVVVIPQEAIKISNENKSRHRTARQTTIYRDISNMKYLIVRLMVDSPRKYAKFFDEMISTVSHAKQSVMLALDADDDATRFDDLNYAKIMIEDLQDDAAILCHMNVISKNGKKEIKKLGQKVAAQAVRLRDYFKGEGVGVNGNTL